jgi:formyltetrahydrofolate deformylase
MGKKLEQNILTITCPDKAGIAAEVFGFIKDVGGFITDASQYGDPVTNLFFMRIEFSTWVSSSEQEAFRQKFAPIAKKFVMDWKLFDGNKPLKAIVAVSKHGHCLNDLLHRHKNKKLGVEIVGVVSNHENMRELVEWHDIPYHCFAIKDAKDKLEKKNQEQKILKVFDESGADMMVLARYMQILSSDMCKALSGRCINIHHSFLPSFKGARPYHQAHARGVKIIGATAHFVTENLDEGPIIEQAVERVDHSKTADELVEIGQDLENVVLFRAVKYYGEHRILLNGNRTVVFK